MIFQRAIRRELLNTVGAVFTALFTIVITVMLIRILGDAAAGKVASTDVAVLRSLLEQWSPDATAQRSPTV